MQNEINKKKMSSLCEGMELSLPKEQIETLKNQFTDGITIDVYGQGICQAFLVYGNSMDDGTINCIPEKTIVAGPEIESYRWGVELNNYLGKNLVFVYNVGIHIAQLLEYNFMEDWILLHYLNPNKELYPDGKRPLSHVSKIFSVTMRQLD